MRTCSTCGFYIPAEHCRDDLKTELQNAEIDGFCGEVTNCLFFVPHVNSAPNTHCGKWAEPISKERP